MHQRHLLCLLLAICAGLAFSQPATAQSDRNTGSRSRSEPGRGRAVGQEVSENPAAEILLSIPPVEHLEAGLLGTTWLARGIAQNFIQLAEKVAQNISPEPGPAPNEVFDVEPPQASEPISDYQPVPAVSQPMEPAEVAAEPAGLPEPVVDLEPTPRPIREAEIFPEVPAPTPPADELVIPEPEPAEPEPEPAEPVLPVTTEPEPVVPEPDEPVALPIETETPSEFELRTNNDFIETNMPVLSELMAKLEKLDAPSDTQPDGAEKPEQWRNEKDREAGDPKVGLNSSDAVAFREAGDESLLSPGHGAEVNYPGNPNTNLVDGEIARLAPAVGSGGLGGNHPKVFALASLSTNAEFEQAMVLSPLSKLGIGAITTSVGSVDPANLTFNRAIPSMPNPTVSERVRSMSRGNAKQMKIALTFDDGPHPMFTNKILAILDHYGVKATFFYVGLQAKKYPQWVKMTNQAGHEIASQTYDHFRLPKLPLEEKQYQIDEYQRLIEDIIGVTPRFMRPPGGQLDESTKRLLTERGMVLGLWDVALNDTREGKTAADMLKTAKNQVRPGSVLLVHDGIEATIEVLPELIEYLHAQGYEFVTMSELAQGL